MPTDAVPLFLETWRAIAQLGAGLDDPQWQQPTDCPGWTVKDLVAHMAGTEHTLDGDPLPSEPIMADHVRNPLGAFNEAWVEHYRGHSGPEMLADFEAIMARRSETIGGFSDAQLEADIVAPFGVVPMRQFLGIRVIDCFIHEQDMRRALGLGGRLDSKAAAFAVVEVRQRLPKAIAHDAQAPDGTTVAFVVEGPAGQSFGVSVAGGRGTLLPEPPPTPSCTLDLDVESFLCLVWGRWSGAEAVVRARVGLEGDTELARRILDHMGQVI